MPSRRVTTAAVAALAALGLLAGGCAVGPSDRPAVAVRDAPLPPPPATTGEQPPAALPPLEPAERGSIDFGDCTGEVVAALGAAATRPDLAYECGSIAVELNPELPILPVAPGPHRTN